MFTNFKNSFTRKLSDKCVVKHSAFFKCLAILPCDLSLITIHISDWRHFSGSHISQGCVATCLRRGGIFKYSFDVNLLLSLPVKTVLKSVNIGEVMGKSLVSCFFDSQCRLHADWYPPLFTNTHVNIADSSDERNLQCVPIKAYTFYFFECFSQK